MLDFLSKYGKDYMYSQNTEEGILEECFKRMEIEKGVCCEIGCSDGRWCSNTALLVDKGWLGVMVESDFALYEKAVANFKGKDVKITCSMVDASNVNAFVDESCDVVSIDTDGSADYEIFEAMKAKPKIVIVEINSSFPPDEDHLSAERGASYKTMVELGIKKGYFLLCHTGNLVFCLNEYKKLFPEVRAGHPIKNSDKYFRTDWLKKIAV